METWQYLKKFGKPLTKKQYDLRRLSGDTSDKKYDFISENEYKKEYGWVCDEKIEKTKKAIRIYSKIGWIKCIAITGSVASDYPNLEDDIDLMFICSKNTLWISRILVYLISWKSGFGIRRSSTNIKDMLCMNLWIEESYVLPEPKRNLANAMDSILAKVVYGELVYRHFLKKNIWIKKFVRNGYDSRLKNEVLYQENRVNLLIKLVNFIAYTLSVLYMQKKGKEMVGIDHAFFHP